MKRKLTCPSYFIILKKIDFQESTPEVQMLMVRLAQTSHFRLWDIIPYPPPPPPEVPTSFSHILCKISEHTYVQKDKLELGGGGEGGNYVLKILGGGNDVLKIFFYFQYV